MLHHVLIPFATAAALSLALVPACRWFGRRYGYLSHATADRWHRGSVPLLGGMGIFGAVAIGLLILQGAPDRPVVAGCAAAIFVLGLVDDLRALNPTTKLVAQIAVAAAFVLLGDGLHWTGSPAVDTVIALFWIVGVTNAFNLLDNMDGLCAGVALIAGAAWIGVLLSADPDAAALGDVQLLALLMGAAAGFLVYNRRPASIFMGDAGALFFGFSFASVTLEWSGAAVGRLPLFAAAAAPLLVLLAPILDTALVTCTRLLSARSVLLGGYDHASHRLVAAGLSERQAVAVLWAMAAVSGGVGWAVTVLDGSWSILLVTACGIGAAIVGGYLAHVGPAGAFGAAGRPESRVPASPGLSAPAAVRQGAAILLDLCVVATAYYAAYRLRFEGASFDANFQYFLRSLPIVIACQLIALRIAGAYDRTWWRFDVMDAAAFTRAVVGGTIAAQLVILYVHRFSGYSRTVFVINGVILLGALVATRTSFRLIGESIERRRRSGERLAVYGLSEHEQGAFGEFLARSRARYRLVGHFDDAPRQWRRIPGRRMLGDRSRLLELVRSGGVDAVAVGAARAGSPSSVEALRQVCAERRVRLFTVDLMVVDFTDVDARPVHR